MGPDDLQLMIAEAGRAPMPPSRVDVNRALRDGRRIRRTRWSLRAGAAAASIAVAVSVASLPGNLTGARYRNGPASSARTPVRFDPMIRYADFGWLPANLTQRTWQAAAGQLTLEAGGTDPQVSVRLFPAGRSAPGYARDTERISPVCAPGERTDRAPAVHGRAAWWVSSPHTGSGCTDVQLRWQYAPGAWAVADAADPLAVSGDRRNVLYRIAQTLRLGVDEPVRVPFRAGYLPPGLRVAITVETRDTADPSRSRVGLVFDRDAGTASPAVPAISGPPGAAIFVRPMPPRAGEAPNTTAAGHPAYRTSSTDRSGVTTRVLKVFGVQGFEVEIQTSGGAKDAPARILRGLRLLGPDRAAWTTRPVGR